MTSLDEALDGADFATATERICLKGSLISKWETAEYAAAEAQDALTEATEKGQAPAPYVAARDEALAAFQAVQEAVEAASVTFTLTGVSEAVWKATKLRHPPRPDVVLDQMAGYNRDAGSGDLIRVALADPLPDDATWGRLLTRLNDSQFQRLLNTAVGLNEKADGSIPFSYAVSEMIRGSGETSNAPEPSGSAPESSGADPLDGTSSPAT